MIGTIIGTVTEGTIDRGETRATGSTGSTESTGADTPDRPSETDGGAMIAGIIRTAMGGTTAGGTAATGTATTTVVATGDE